MHCSNQRIIATPLIRIHLMDTQNDLSYFTNSSTGHITVSVYGIVIDATQVYTKPQNMKYAATLKIVDYTWSLLNHPQGFTPFIRVLFMGKNKNDVPHIKELGAVIKFNGGLLRVMQEDTGKIIAFLWDKGNAKGNWKIINMNDCLTKLKLNEDEIIKVKTLREFAKNYFERQTIMELTQNLSTARAANEVFSAIVKVVKVKQSSNNFELIKVMDHTDKAYLVIPESEKEEYSYIQRQDFILIKNIYYIDLVARRIQLQQNGNILILPNCLMLLKEYQNIMDIFVDGTTMQMAIEEKKLMTPIEISSAKNTHLPLTSLKKIIGSNGRFGVKYRVKVYVVEIGPGDIKEWVKGYCEKCRRFFGLSKDEVCENCKVIGKMVYQAQLFVKDKDNRDNQEVYRLLLWTHNGKGEDFFNEKPTNCYKSEYLYNKLKQAYEALTRYNVYLDCIVERISNGINSFIQINDTITKL